MYLPIMKHDLKSEKYINPPTTERMEPEGNTENAGYPNSMCTVRKRDYWKVNGVSNGTPTVWQMPIGQ